MDSNILISMNIIIFKIIPLMNNDISYTCADNVWVN